MVAAGAMLPVAVKALSNRAMEFWLPLVTYSLPVAAGAGVGVGVGEGTGVGLGVGVGDGLGPPPRVLRGEITQPLNITARNNKVKRKIPVVRGTVHLYKDSFLMTYLQFWNSGAVWGCCKGPEITVNTQS
jgi:hypothetical protein